MLARMVALVTALSLSGCSWIFMTRAPSTVSSPHMPVQCTSSRAAPILDTICAGYFVANGIFLLAQKDCTNASWGETCVSSGTRTGGAVLSAGLAALCTAAAVSGYGYADRCEDVQALNTGCMGGDEVACRKLNVNWMPPPPTGWRAPGGFVPPAAPPSGPPDAPAPINEGTNGCTRDTDCKGDRICERGTCVSPSSSSPAPR